MAALLPMVVLAGGADRSRTYLVLVTGLRLGPGEYVDRVSDVIWGATILAVCHLPPGWHVTAGSNTSLDGMLGGEAMGGTAFLNEDGLRQLKGIGLVSLQLPVHAPPGPTVPRRSLAVSASAAMAMSHGRARFR